MTLLMNTTGELLNEDDVRRIEEVSIFCIYLWMHVGEKAFMNMCICNTCIFVHKYMYVYQYSGFDDTRGNAVYKPYVL